MNILNKSSEICLRSLSPAGSRGRLLVITYHRVPADPDSMVPSEPHARLFKQQVTQLARFCNVLPLHEAVKSLGDGSIPERAACITFDDGYRNNLTVAAPILRALGLPATFFVTRDAVRTGAMWNDLVIEAVRSRSAVFDLASLGLQDDPEAWNAGLSRYADYIVMQLKYLPLNRRLEIAREIYCRSSSLQEPRLMMMESEVAQLARQGFDIGGHTLTHPILATLSDADAMIEIQGSASWLEGITGVAPVSFAYTNGRPGRDYKPEHVKMVSDAGFQCAVSTEWACATSKSDPLQIPRVGLSSAQSFGQFMHLLKLYLSSYS